MTTHTALRLMTAVLATSLFAGALVSAQGQMLPSTPKKAFGASISPAYDGWYDNADGTHTFLIGYYNRNWTAEVDVPIGPERPGTAGVTMVTASLEVTEPPVLGVPPAVAWLVTEPFAMSPAVTW